MKFYVFQASGCVRSDTAARLVDRGKEIRKRNLGLTVGISMITRQKAQNESSQKIFG